MDKFVGSNVGVSVGKVVRVLRGAPLESAVGKFVSDDEGNGEGLPVGIVV